MRKLFLYMTVSFDGYLAGPGGELDWMLRTPDQELNDDIVALFSSADMGIIGYPAAVGMIPYWAGVPNRPDAPQSERDLAKAINKIHSVILSNSDVKVDYANTEVQLVRSDQDLIDIVGRLKQKPGKDIGVPGGVRTAQNFVRLGLLDEYILMVHPIAIGKGQPLFTTKTDLETVSAKAYASGVIRLRLRPRPTNGNVSDNKNISEVIQDIRLK